MAKTHSISMTVTMNAEPTEVFDSLTSSKKMYQWSGQRAKVEATIGGTFEMFDGWVKGKVLAYQPGKLLSYTWHPVDWSKETKSSIVKFKFLSSGKKTKILLNHTGFPDVSSKNEHHDGWLEHVFNPLKQFFESR